MKRYTRALMSLGLGTLFAATAPAALAGKGSTKGSAIQVAVTDNGFEPANISVKKGQPVTLVVTRKTDATCAKQIVIDEHAIKQDLPLNKPVTVSFTPKKSGELKYGCAMGKMIGGVIRVQ